MAAGVVHEAGLLAGQTCPEAEACCRGHDNMVTVLSADFDVAVVSGAHLLETMGDAGHCIRRRPLVGVWQRLKLAGCARLAC